MLIEYAEPDEADSECLGDVVSAVLPGILFKFMVSEGLATAEQKEMYLGDWNVTEVNVEEVDVVLEDTENSCVRTESTRTVSSVDAVKPCEGHSCARRLPLHWDYEKR